MNSRNVFAIAIVLLMLIGCTEERREESAGSATTHSQNAPAKNQTAEFVFRSISPVEAMRMLELNKEVLLLDVRTPQERRLMRVSGSHPVPVGDVIRGKLKVEHERPIILLCAIGGRSYIAGRVLSARGYREVYNLKGGIEAWRQAGLPLEKGPEGRNEAMPVEPEKGKAGGVHRIKQGIGGAGAGRISTAEQ